MQIRNIWIDKRVPGSMNCPDCSTRNAALYRVTLETSRHQYVCKSCGSTKALTVDELNRYFYESIGAKTA